METITDSLGYQRRVGAFWQLSTTLCGPYPKQRLAWGLQTVWPFKLAQRLLHFLRQALLILWVQLFSHTRHHTSSRLHKCFHSGEMEMDRNGLYVYLMKSPLVKRSL